MILLGLFTAKTYSYFSFQHYNSRSQLEYLNICSMFNLSPLPWFAAIGYPG